MKKKKTPTADLKPRAPQKGILNVIIETPKGSRNKYKYEEKLGVFSLSGVLPAGAVFPFDFGYVPGTKAQDGDPLDVLVLMDVPAFPGCLIPSRVLGVMEVEQTEETGQTVRNDRLLAVAAAAKDFGDIKTWRDLNRNLVDEIGHFFVSYNEIRGRKFKLLGIRDPQTAQATVNKTGRKAHPPKRKAA